MAWITRVNTGYQISEKTLNHTRISKIKDFKDFGPVSYITVQDKFHI